MRETSELDSRTCDTQSRGREAELGGACQTEVFSLRMFQITGAIRIEEPRQRRSPTVLLFRQIRPGESQQSGLTENQKAI